MNTKVSKIEHVKVDVLATIQVAREGSKFFYDKLALVSIEYSKYKVLSYNGKLPNVQAIVVDDTSNNIYCTKTLDKRTSDIMVCAIINFKQSFINNEHTQPYTYLVAFCTAMGVDLFSMGILSK